MEQAFAVVALSAIVVLYAHFAIPRFTRGWVKREAAHGILLAVGIAFGLTCAYTPGLSVPRWVAFAAGFGLVHAPAAAILFIKRLRGSGPS
jgi:hypothetical protein